MRIFCARSGVGASPVTALRAVAGVTKTRSWDAYAVALIPGTNSGGVRADAPLLRRDSWVLQFEAAGAWPQCRLIRAVIGAPPQGHRSPPLEIRRVWYERRRASSGGVRCAGRYRHRRVLRAGITAGPRCFTPCSRWGAPGSPRRGTIGSACYPRSFLGGPPRISTVAITVREPLGDMRGITDVGPFWAHAGLPPCPLGACPGTAPIPPLLFPSQTRSLN